MNKALILLLFYTAVSNANIRFLDSIVNTLSTTDYWNYVPPALSYNTNLTCDQCIRSGYVFCVQGPEHMRVWKKEQMPPTKCCADS